MATRYAARAKHTHIKNPETTPARNSFEIDTPPPAANAKMIMLWLGGMMIPAIEDVTVTFTA